MSPIEAHPVLATFLAATVYFGPRLYREIRDEWRSAQRPNRLEEIRDKYKKANTPNANAD